MRGIAFAVVAALVLSACGGGSSGSSSGGPVGPNAQEENLVAAAVLLSEGTGGIAVGHPGVVNDTGEAVVGLIFHYAGAPFTVDVFGPTGGWIPDGSGWVQPIEMGEGFYDVRATTQSGRVIFTAFIFEVGVSEVVTLD